MEKDLTQLLEQVKSYNPKADTALIKRAYHFAKEAHEGQKRFSGEPYFSHPLATARGLAGLKLDAVTIAAGLLHDVPEDTPLTLEDVEKEFGKELAFLVGGITKIGRIKLKGSREEEFLENLRRLFLVMAKDLRVVFIKLCDRLHNMQTLQYVPQHKQKRIARETLEVYAPLADRLGIGEIKGELEDLAFPYVYPEDYRWVKKISAPRREDFDKYVPAAKRALKRALDKEGIEAEIQGRAKHLYSLYRKLLLKDRDIANIYDLVALRVVVEDVEACYAVLGSIHHHWKPLLGLIKDYIAQPKPNGYQSLHTTIFGPEGKIIEIQVRSREMHEASEYGAAAHWQYARRKKLAKSEDHLDANGGIPEEKLAWVRRLVSWQQEIENPEEFKKTLKLDVFAKRIFVFTPKGDVVDLPAGATPIDFAYEIHSEIGDGCVGAKVGGKMVGLDTKLQNGDIVEIVVSKKSRGPKRDWLGIAVTAEAKRKIRQGIKRRVE